MRSKNLAIAIWQPCLELLVHVVDAAAQRLATDPADLNLLQLQELLRRLEGILHSLNHITLIIRK